MCFLLIDIFSIPDGNDGNDEPLVLNLVDEAVVTDTDAIGIPSF
jgi:hypothetical protein